MKVGDHVRLVPSQGVYQEPKVGMVVGETRTEWRVKVPGSMHIVRFRKATGNPIEKIDQGFPYYRISVEQRGISPSGQNK